jgi:Protein of unknown function (DUF1501)
MDRIINRRIFFEIAGAGVAGYFLSPFDTFAQVGSYQGDAAILNTARYVIFIQLAGAPSQVDTLDLKVGAWTPPDFNPTTINGVDFPAGLLPGLASQSARFSIVRSCQSSALVHNLLQAWNQIARNPASATGKIAPNVGSVVALEFEPKKMAGQNLPGFVSLSSAGNLVRNGYLPGRYAPFDITAAPTGLANLSNVDGEATFNDRYSVLQQLNATGVRRSDFDEMADFYAGARSMMYDNNVNAAFRFTTQDQLRYGNSAFGNSCIVARNLVTADLGTRYIMITLGGWDNHTNIYLQNAGVYRPATQLDAALANLIGDLAVIPGANGRSKLDETLIVAKGEFGRTVGPITAQLGRDHYFVHSALFAGGGVRGGQVIGSTTADGRSIDRPGWSEDREVQAEDIAATIYSALGINYTTVRRDDPLGRGFEYIPSTNAWKAAPIRELFG